MLSLASLRQPLTKAEAVEVITDQFTALGFDTTGWQDGRIQKTILMTMALVLSDLSEVVKAGVEFGFNLYATGQALNEYSRSRFDNEKTEAVATAGPMTLTSTSSVPNVIAVGQLMASTATGVEFRNTTGGTLSAGSVATPSTLVLQWQAVIKGSSGNVGLSTVTRLLTPIAGVTVANSSGTPWYTTTGADEESDASIQQRNTTKWSTLSVEAVAEALESIARTAGATKVKVHDSNPRGPGTVDVYAAGDASLLGTAVMEAIQLAYSLRLFDCSDAWVTPWPVGDTTACATKHPALQTLDITATVYHDPVYTGSVVLAAVQTALRDFLRTLDIGGSDYSPGPSNVVLREDLIDTIKNVEGVRTVVMTTPSATVSVGALSLVTEGTWSLTMTAVTT